MSNGRQQCWCNVINETKPKSNQTAQKITPFSLFSSMASLLLFIVKWCVLKRDCFSWEMWEGINRMFWRCWCGQWLSRVTAGSKNELPYVWTYWHSDIGNTFVCVCFQKYETRWIPLSLYEYWLQISLHVDSFRWNRIVKYSYAWLRVTFLNGTSFA
jgi:hypothetical protein